MTCRQIDLLLEDYVDGELAPDLVAQVEAHLKGCSSCRKEYEETVRLKSLLAGRPARLPGEDYFNETERLILARTVESGSRPSVTSIEDPVTKRNALIRSIVSVAASLLVFFSAIFIGSQQPTRALKTYGPESPVFALVPLEDTRASDNSVIITYSERLTQARGMLLMGSPGALGRFVILFDFQ